MLLRLSCLRKSYRLFSLFAGIINDTYQCHFTKWTNTNRRVYHIHITYIHIYAHIYTYIYIYARVLEACFTASFRLLWICFMRLNFSVCLRGLGGDMWERIDEVCKKCLPYICIHIYIYTYIHTYIHIYTYICIYMLTAGSNSKTPHTRPCKYPNSRPLRAFKGPSS